MAGWFSRSSRHPKRKSCRFRGVPRVSRPRQDANGNVRPPRRPRCDPMSTISPARARRGLARVAGESAALSRRDPQPALRLEPNRDPAPLRRGAGVDPHRSAVGLRRGSRPRRDGGSPRPGPLPRGERHALPGVGLVRSHRGESRAPGAAGRRCSPPPPFLATAPGTIFGSRRRSRHSRRQANGPGRSWAWTGRSIAARARWSSATLRSRCRRLPAARRVFGRSGGKSSAAAGSTIRSIGAAIWHG